MTSRILKSTRSNSVDTSSSGGLDEEQFLSLFGDVPKLNLYSQRDALDKLNKIRELISSPTVDWDKRCLALKEIRSLILQDHLKDVPDLQQQLRVLDIGLQMSLKDLRSQVVREACITIACLAREMEGRFEPSAEPMVQVLVPLMQNSAKVMATSAVTSIKFVIKYVHSPKLISSISSNLASKSNVIRKYCCEFLYIILNEWSRSEMERQVSVIQEAIKKGLSDADAEARFHSRRSFASFSMTFPEQGYSLLMTFDASKQKQLLAELDNPDLFESLGSQFKTPLNKGRGVAPDLVASSTPKPRGASRVPLTPRLAGSVSKIASTPKAFTPLQRNQFVPKVESKIKSRQGVSHSTPTSRTGSPSRSVARALNMPPPDVTTTLARTPHYGTMRTPKVSAHNGNSTAKKMTSQSQCNSRNVSPTRRELKYNGFSTIGRRASDNSTILSESFLQNSSFTSMRALPISPGPDSAVEYGRNLEAAISDAWRQKSTWFRSSDDVDAFSETSSVCSESSSYRSHSDMTEDTLDILSRLVCGLWTERKEGVVALQKFLRAGKKFNNGELKRVMDILMRMFHDSHPKVLSAFVDAVWDLVHAHHPDILDLLPSILSRLFGKAGSDVLGNLQEKINRALDAIRSCFPGDRQVAAVCRYVTEQPHTINVKVKLTLLGYFLNLSLMVEPTSLTNTSDIRATISKILTWTSEPKNGEVRKLSQSIIVTLANRCPDQFAAILSLMPKTYQDGARKILSDHGGLNSKLAPPSSATKSSRTFTPKLQAPVESASRRSGLRKNSLASLDDPTESWDGIVKASEELQQLSLLEELNLGLMDDTAPMESFSENDDFADLGILLEKIKDSKDFADWSKAVNQLVSVVKASDSRELWDAHFKMTYVLLLEALQDTENLQRKYLGLLVLREMLEKHSQRFHPYAELTIMNLLDMEREKDRDVIRVSDECRSILSRVFPLDQVIGILNPICLTATYPINMAAVKLFVKVFQFAPTNLVREFVSIVTPGLVKGFEHEESGMRKASMLCLVCLHKHVGDELVPYIKDLSPNKMKLLNIYIKKSVEDIQ